MGAHCVLVGELGNKESKLFGCTLLVRNEEPRPRTGELVLRREDTQPGLGATSPYTFALSVDQAKELSPKFVSPGVPARDLPRGGEKEG